jgi:hypothetical protein
MATTPPSVLDRESPGDAKRRAIWTGKFCIVFLVTVSLVIAGSGVVFAVGPEIKNPNNFRLNSLDEGPSENIIYSIESDDRFEPNDKLSNPAEIDPGHYEDLSSSSQDPDVYVVKGLQRGDTVNVGVFFEHSEGNLNLWYYMPDEDGNRVVGTGGISHTDNEEMSITMEYTDYKDDSYPDNSIYIIVSAGGDDVPTTSYDMNIHINGADRFEPNEGEDWNAGAPIDPGQYTDLFSSELNPDIYVVNEIEKGDTISASIQFDPSKELMYLHYAVPDKNGEYQIGTARPEDGKASMTYKIESTDWVKDKYQDGAIYLAVGASGSGARYDLTVDVESTSDNALPSVTVDWSPEPVVTGKEITFDASASSDPDGSIGSYKWDFDGDSQYEDTGVTAHTVFSNLNPTVTLKVTDNDGQSTTKTIDISAQYPDEGEPGGSWEKILIDDGASLDGDYTVEPGGSLEITIVGEWEEDHMLSDDDDLQWVRLVDVDSFGPTCVLNSSDDVVFMKEIPENPGTRHNPYTFTVSYSTLQESLDCAPSDQLQLQAQLIAQPSSKDNPVGLETESYTHTEFRLGADSDSPNLIIEPTPDDVDRNNNGRLEFDEARYALWKAHTGESSPDETRVPFTISTSPPASISPGEPVTLTYRIENTGDTDLASLGVKLSNLPNDGSIEQIDGDAIEETNLNRGIVLVEPIQPGDETTLSVTINTSESLSSDTSVEAEIANGFGTGEVSKVKTTTIQVETSGDSSIERFDTNNDGKIGFTEVLNAISAYNTDSSIGGSEVSFQDVLDVITAYNTNRAS